MAAEPRAPSASAAAALQVWALYKKETRAYFESAVAYVAAAAFLLLTGYLFAKPLLMFNVSGLDALTGWPLFFLVVFVPAMTMRLYSEEYRSGTIELLSTLPVPSWAVLAAKYLAVLTVLAFTLCGALAYPMAVELLGSLDRGAALTTFAGLFLTGSVAAAMGVFASSLTASQIVAFIVGFGLALVPLLLGMLFAYIPLWLQGAASALAYQTHLENLSRGIVDTRDLAYYALASLFFLFLAHLRTDKEARP